MPKKKWLYFPFKDISKDSTMPQNKTRYEEKYKEQLTVAFKGESLAEVGDEDMLIIAGHGLPNSDRIGVAIDEGTAFLGLTLESPTQVTMTANDLADELAAAKLPKSHQFIKLITCGGAGMVAVDDANVKIAGDEVLSAPVTKHEHPTECLASVLARRLGDKGYDRVWVKGYPGFVDARGRQKTVRVEGTSALSQSKKWYQIFGDGVAHGFQYWKDGKVGMVHVPSNLLNDYWFDKTGKLKHKIH